MVELQTKGRNGKALNRELAEVNFVDFRFERGQILRFCKGL